MAPALKPDPEAADSTSMATDGPRPKGRFQVSVLPPAGRRGLCAAIGACLALLLAAGPARASAPDPGGDENSPITAPPAGKLYGFAGIRQVGGPAPAVAAPLITAVGGNASRTTLHWQALEPQRDRYDYARLLPYDALYATLTAVGIHPIFVLQYAPAWARDPGAPQDCGTYDSCHYPPARSMLGEWREFVAFIARRYPKAAIEVWNEPNDAGQWKPWPDPGRYAELVAEADRAAASVDPSIPVYAGGLETVQKTNALAAADFLRKTYAGSPSLRGHTDAVNLHLYPGKDLGAGSSFAKTFANIRAVRSDAGDRSTPLLISELGATTTGPWAVSGAEQADIVLRATRRILTMPDTLGVLVYTLADRAEFAQSNPERGFGLLGSGAGGILRPKPAYCALLSAALGTAPGCPEPGGKDSSRSDGGATAGSGGAGEADPAPQPRRLALTGHLRGHLRAGGRTRQLRIVVRGSGFAAPAAGGRVCVKHHAKLLRLRGRRCRSLAGLGTSAPRRVGFRANLRRRGAGRTVRVRFAARTAGSRARLRLTLRGR